MPKPRLIVIAGPNGSGKSTLTRQLQGQGLDFGEYINPDEIAAQLAGSYEWRVRAAQKVADQRRDACIRERRCFSFETVMSHPSKIDIMRRAREAGFDVTLYFVGTQDPRINIARVRNRVALGGHDVPSDLVVARYYRTMGSLWDAALSCNRTFVYDSSTLRNGIAFWAHVETEPKNASMGFHVVNRRTIKRADENPAVPRWVVKFLLAPADEAILRAISAGERPAFLLWTNKTPTGA